MMDQILQNKKQVIELFKRDLAGFTNVANSTLTSLHSEFTEQGFNTFPIERNEFRFKYFGLSFITKTEILIEENLSLSRCGTISTYIVNKDGDELLKLSYEFDKIGNINSKYLQNEFSTPYYFEFIESLISHCHQSEIKIPIE